MKELIIRLLKTKWTKWKPLHVYCFGSESFIILGRINRKTGMAQFRNIKISPRSEVPSELRFDKQFQTLLDIACHEEI